jgi:hypothetical protein
LKVVLSSSYKTSSNIYYLPLKGAIKVSDVVWDQTGMNYPKKRTEEAYDARVPLTEGTLVDNLDPQTDFLKGGGGTKAVTREVYNECVEVEAELHARRSACTEECRRETGTYRKGADGKATGGRLGLADAAPGKQCVCGAMYLPAPRNPKPGLDSVLDPRDEEAEIEAEGGENKLIIVGHTLKMAGWAEHGPRKRAHNEREPMLAEKNLVGWSLTQKTRNPGWLAGEGVMLDDNSQPVPLPMDIQVTRKVRRVQLLQEEQEQPGSSEKERGNTWTASLQKEEPAEKSAASAAENVQGKGRGGKRGRPEQDDDEEHSGKRQVSMSNESKEGKQRNILTKSGLVARK